MYKIIGTDGQQYGPITAEQLRRWFAERRVNAQTPVQPEGAQEWRGVATLPEFAADLLQPGAPPIGFGPPRGGGAGVEQDSGRCLRHPAGRAGDSQIHSRLHGRRTDHAARLVDWRDINLRSGFGCDACDWANRRHYLPDQDGRGVRAQLRGWTQGVVLKCWLGRAAGLKLPENLTRSIQNGRGLAALQNGAGQRAA